MLQCPAIARCTSYSTATCACTTCNQYFSGGACTVRERVGLPCCLLQLAGGLALHNCNAGCGLQACLTVLCRSPAPMALRNFLILTLRCSAQCPAPDVPRRPPMAAAARRAAMVTRGMARAAANRQGTSHPYCSDSRLSGCSKPQTQTSAYAVAKQTLAAVPGRRQLQDVFGHRLQLHGLQSVLWSPHPGGLQGEPGRGASARQSLPHWWSLAAALLCMH